MLIIKQLDIILSIILNYSQAKIPSVRKCTALKNTRNFFALSHRSSKFFVTAYFDRNQKKKSGERFRLTSLVCIHRLQVRYSVDASRFNCNLFPEYPQYRVVLQFPTKFTFFTGDAPRQSSHAHEFVKRAL